MKETFLFSPEMTSTFFSYLWFDLLLVVEEHLQHYLRQVTRKHFAQSRAPSYGIGPVVYLNWVLKERIKSACLKLHLNRTLLSYICATFEYVTTSQSEVLLNHTARERRIPTSPPPPLIWHFWIFAWYRKDREESCVKTAWKNSKEELVKSASKVGTVVRRPRAHKVDHSKFTFTSPSKKENSSCLGRIPSEKPRFVCLPVQNRAVWPNGGVLSSPSSCTSCYGNQVDACDQGFVSTMLWLKFRSDGYPSCVWGLCSSSEDAEVRLGWLVVVHDVPGPLAVFRERGVGKCQSMSAATRRSSFSETVLALLFQRPEVSITWGVRTVHFLQALDQRRASNNRLLSRSLYMHVRDEPRWS